MRLIVHGVGAVGGTIAVAASLAGQEVVGIARGAQLAAIRETGLTLQTPSGPRHARFPCVGDPSEIELRPDDAVLLCVKTQHTEAALDQLWAAGLREQPVFCFQNGVENERLALRRFPNVHGVTVMLPAEFLSPGEVAAFGAPCHAIFDIGRYPGGSDAADDALAAQLTAANMQSFVKPDVMVSKYGKLLLNLGNIVGAALGSGPANADVTDRLKDEARAVFRAAGIGFEDVGLNDPRRTTYMQISEVEGARRVGSSTAQSLARGAGSIETDYLNGEVVLLGRLHCVPTPGNAWFADLGRRMLAEGIAPGSVTREDVEAALGF